MRRVTCAVLTAAVLTVAPAAAQAAENGQWVAVAAQSLVTFNPGGPLGERRIYTAPAGARLDAPQWSPDGNRIVFVEDSRVLVMEAAGGAVSEVASGAHATSWSPE